MRYRSRWLDLMAMTRVLGAIVAVVLLMAHDVSDHDGWLIVATVGWTAFSLAAYGASVRLQRSPLAWLVDMAVVLELVYLSTDWRSPFYIFALTALILRRPSCRSGARWGGGSCSPAATWSSRSPPSAWTAARSSVRSGWRSSRPT